VGWQSGHAFACRMKKYHATSEFIGVRIPSPPLNPKIDFKKFYHKIKENLELQ
jgi:hypothetical protein